MPTSVTDTSSHRQNKIANATRVLGKSGIRQRVFEAVCFGKSPIKTVKVIRQRTGLSEKQILIAGNRLDSENLIKKVKVDKRIAYKKDAFYCSNKQEIIRLVRNKSRLEKYPTSYTPSVSGAPSITTIRLPVPKPKARRITVDEIESFARVRGVDSAPDPRPLREARFKRGLQKIFSEKGRFTDWGGETDDLYSTRVKVKGTRKAAAFALKGRATPPPLTPKKMGRNGDQIQRLFRSPADVFIVQYWAQVDESVHEQVEKFAQAKAAVEGREIFHGVIDGQDSQRLIKAYRKLFGNV